MKEKIKTLLKVTVSLGLIIYLVSTKVNKDELINNFKLLDWRYIPVIFLIIMTHYAVSSFRWKALVIHQKSDEVTRRYLFKLYFVGAFFNNFMPTSIGGDVYKIYKLGKKLDSTAVGFSSVFTERFTGILMLFLIGLLSMTKTVGFGVLVLVLWLVLGMYIGMFVLAILSKKIKFFGKIYDALAAYKDHPKKLMFAMLTSIVVQLLSISTQYLTFRALGVHLPIFYCLLAFPIITLVGFFVPSINGFGVQDTLYMSMFSIVGVPVNTALSASIVYHLIRIGVSLIGGVMYALGKEL